MSEYWEQGKLLGETFQRAITQEDMEIAWRTAKINNGTGTMQDVSKVASITGRKAGEMTAKEITSIWRNNPVTTRDVADILHPVMRANHGVITDLTGKVIKKVNDDAGIGLNAVDTEYNPDRMENLAELIAESADFEAVMDDMPDYLENASLSEVDDMVEANADFASEAGLHPTITRSVQGNCCSWCAGLAGTYDYTAVKAGDKDVFRRHQRCRCLIEYDPDDGTGVETVNNYAK